MRKFKNTALLTMALGLGVASAQASQELRPENAKTTEVMVNIAGSYIPPNFDSGEPFVVVNGLYPNSCYTWSRGQVDHIDSKTHEIRVFANVRMGMCLMVLVPFSDEISLGRLEKGIHTLRFIGSDGTYTEKQLKIE